MAGNLALKEVADRLQSAARAMDVVGRYGGEEFVIVLPDCDLDGARQFGERIRRLIEETPLRIGEQRVPVTISIGCACFRPGEDKASFIDRADRALYLAKQNGRNRVEAAPE